VFLQPLQLAEEGPLSGDLPRKPAAPAVQTATRLRVEPEQILFTDRIPGHYPAKRGRCVGDMILKRAIEYSPTCWRSSSMTPLKNHHVIRGADLFGQQRRGKSIYSGFLGLPLPIYGTFRC